MGLVYEKLIRPALFRLDPEEAHNLAVKGLSLLSRSHILCRLMARYNQVNAIQPIELFGHRFPNRVGIAAGMDKNAQFWRAVGALGFGHIEIGTVTHQAQDGQPKPRMFRYPQETALINRMGFNNQGAARIAEKLKADSRQANRPIVLGINIGKSKLIPLRDAAQDYLGSFHLLVDYADYFVINVSSPNTPQLRMLQAVEPLRELLKALQTANRKRAEKLGTSPVPLLVKIAPDLNFHQVDEILSIAQDAQLSGIVVANTTVERPESLLNGERTGGLSGHPLFSKNLNLVRYIYRATRGRLPIIGVGGIEDALSAGTMIDAGASLVQVYTALVYKGPFLGKTLALALAAR